MVPAISAILVAVLAGIAAAQYWRSLVRRRRRKSADLLGRVPIRKVELVEVDPIFKPGPFGPDLTTEVVFLGRGNLRVVGGTSDPEAWILAVLAKRARRLFEFGTCTGMTTYLWARNSPPDARITTLTLGPNELEEYREAESDKAADRQNALAESAFETFVYSGTDVESKVEQLYADSKAFDETPYLGLMDLIFIDGSHAYSYVKSDTEKALRMIRPGGLIAWHDYHGPLGGMGTDRALIELAERLPLRHIKGTEMVIYRAGSDG